MNFVDIVVAGFMFFVLASVVIVSIMYVQEEIGERVIEEFNNSASSLVQGLHFEANVTSIAGQYDEAKFEYDNLFILMFFVLEVSIMSFAVMSPKLPKWSFLTFLFFGTLMLNFSYSYVMDVTQWFIQEFMLDIFSADVTYMPFYNWFNDNQLAVFFLNTIIALGVNFIFGRRIIERPAFAGG